jgi:hypothetical protein
MLLLYFTILIFLTVIFVLLYRTSENKERTGNIKVVPGLKYKVGDKYYKIPNLKVKGNATILDEEFILRLKTLYVKANKVFEQLGIEAWMSGGTLLGFMRHGTFMPWDDDIDSHTDVKNKKKFFNRKNIEIFKENGMELLFMIGMTPDFTYYKGAVRIKLKEYDNPVYDIFFVKDVGNEVKKIENWRKDSYVFNKKEIWDRNCIYPLNKTIIDDIKVSIPNIPDKVLKNQYGDKFMDEIHCSYPAHSVAYDLLKIIWIKP